MSEEKERQKTKELSFYEEFEALKNKETSVPIIKLMGLFVNVSKTYISVFMHAHGLTGQWDAKRMHEYFVMLEKQDLIDDVIWNFEDEIKHA